MNSFVIVIFRVIGFWYRYRPARRAGRLDWGYLVVAGAIGFIVVPGCCGGELPGKKCRYGKFSNLALAELLLV